MRFKPNPQGIELLKNQVREAFGISMGILDQEFDDLIESDYAFSDLGFEDQDIVDTGRFLRSKTVASPSPDIVRWEWAPRNPKNGYVYAAALYCGFNAFGKKYIPGRPWTDRALANVNVPEWTAYELGRVGVKASFTEAL